MILQNTHGSRDRGQGQCRRSLAHPPPSATSRPPEPIWDEEVGGVDFLPPPPRAQPSPEVRKVVIRGSDPNVTGRVVQGPFSPPTRSGPEGSRRAAARAGHERRQRPTTEPRAAPASSRPTRPAPPTAVRLDQSRRSTTRPTEVGLTSLRVSRPVSGARLAVGVVRRGPRLGGLFTRVGSRGEGILRALTDLGVRISPFEPALLQMSGLAHSSPVSPA